MKSKIMIMMMLVACVSCATIPASVHQQKIDDIVDTGVFVPLPSDTPELTKVKQAGTKVAVAGTAGIKAESEKRAAAEHRADKNEKLADVGRYTVGSAIALGIIIFIIVFVKIILPRLPPFIKP
jgi:opacity protein-like surface antigen